MNKDSKIINIYVNDNQKSLETALIVKEKLEQKGFKPTFDFDENALINLCIGGDGAFLRAVHKYEF
ncbi:MAG: NAD(+) kinase, partial [Finegoldia magna]|nr:NAD(+) kinase [Finegoldia magna]